MSRGIHFIYCKPDRVGGIAIYPHILYPQFPFGSLAMLTDVQVRKIQPLDKKAKYSDEKVALSNLIIWDLKHIYTKK